MTNIREENMLELAEYICAAAPRPVLEKFSTDFLVESFKKDPTAFDSAWVEYTSQKGGQNNENGHKVIEFPNQKRGQCPSELEENQ